MRLFAVEDSLRPGCLPCAFLTYDETTGDFTGTVEPWATQADVPLQFWPAIEDGSRRVSSRWANSWISERLPPPSRQNIGQILRAHGIEAYDAGVLLSHNGMQPSSQDDFVIREITPGQELAYRIGRAIAHARVEQGLTQAQLAGRAGMRQEMLSRLERGLSNPTLQTIDKLAKALGLQAAFHSDSRGVSLMSFSLP